jgi:hypothetical protein
VLGSAGKLVAKYYPGVPLVPSMSTGATDGIFLETIGIPSYGPPACFRSGRQRHPRPRRTRSGPRGLYWTRNYARILLAGFGAFAVYMAMGGLLFGALPLMKTEFMKYPAVYRSQEGIKQ